MSEENQTDDPRTPDIVLIIWRDCSTLEQWINIPDLIEFAGDERVIKTVGFLIHEDEDKLIVSSSHEGTFGKVAGAWIVPKKQIIEWKKVVEWK